MNKHRYWHTLWRAYLPWIASYAVMMMVLGMLILFYHANKQIFIDAIRFTLPLLVIWLTLLGRHYCQAAKRVSHHQPIQPTDPVQSSLMDQEQHSRQTSQKEEQRLNQLYQQQYDHLELYSHEIKNSLMTLQAAAENDQNVKSEVINSAVRQANYHLDLMLNDQRLAMPSHDYDFEWINLGRLIRGIVQDNSALFIKRQLIPQLKGVGDVAVLTDRKWLRFCINQLLSNAIKYSPEGENIVISWQGRSLSFTNAGDGISQTDLPRVFDNGFSGRNGHQTTKSTGMGLYLVKKVTEQLNFTVHLQSTSGHLTTASLRFPSSNIRQS
ncbi:sensor histidine kinase [Limosilactobacillus sp.]|uniref:sensor histidine kinase n=1 Tax=Limosilactobacillus sp. TaxID=2773925 RepID=UPI00345E2ADD